MRPENLEKIMSMSSADRKARRQAVLRDYNRGMTANQIAAKYDISYQTVYIYLRRENYQPKYFGERTKTAKGLEDKILKLQELFTDPPQDLQGLQQLVSKASYILQPDSL